MDQRMESLQTQKHKGWLIYLAGIPSPLRTVHDSFNNTDVVVYHMALPFWATPLRKEMKMLLIILKIKGLSPQSSPTGIYCVLLFLAESP